MCGCGACAQHGVSGVAARVRLANSVETHKSQGGLAVRGDEQVRVVGDFELTWQKELQRYTWSWREDAARARVTKRKRATANRCTAAIYDKTARTTTNHTRARVPPPHLLPLLPFLLRIFGRRRRRGKGRVNRRPRGPRRSRGVGQATKSSSSESSASLAFKKSSTNALRSIAPSPSATLSATLSALRPFFSSWGTDTSPPAFLAKLLSAHRAAICSSFSLSAKPVWRHN